MNDARQHADSLFDPEPRQWGLRGDPYLWREMRAALAEVAMPESVESLKALFGEVFFELTGQPLDDGRAFHVARLAHGGMSSGMVSPAFWAGAALELVCGRWVLLGDGP